MFNDPFCSQISSGTLIADRANNQLFGTLQQLGRGTCLHHCGANSLVNVCGAALKGIANHSRGVLTDESRTRSSHRVHELDKRMLGLPTFSQMPPAIAVTYALLRERKSHTSVLFETAVPLPDWQRAARPFRSRGPLRPRIPPL